MGEPNAKKLDKKGADLVPNYMNTAKSQLRKQKTSLNRKDEWSKGPLHQAANKYNADEFNKVLKRVLKEDTEESWREAFDSFNESGDTLLHVAVNHGNTDALKLICSEFPCLLNKRNRKGDTVWHVAAAAKTRYLEVFKELFDLRNSFIEQLMYLNYIESEKEVTWRDVSLREINEEGNTALHVALINGHKSMADQLVKQDWILSYYVNKENKSALYLAAESGYLDTLKLMLENESLKGHENNGTKIGDAKTSYGGTVRESLKGKSLVQAAIMGRHIDVLDFLLDEKLVPENEDGWTPLHWAASVGFVEGFDHIKKKCPVSPTETGENGRGILLTSNGQNVLHVAAKNGKLNVVSYILKTPELDNLINMRDKNGNTPLHCATMNYHPRTVNALTWDSRVDLNSKNEDGFTPLDSAESTMKGISSFQQWLTWQALKVAGATQGSAGKIIDAEGPTSSIQLEPATTGYYKGKKKTFLSMSILVGIISFILGSTLHGVYNNSFDTDQTSTISKLRNVKFYLFIFCATIAMSSCIVAAVALIWAQLGNINKRVFKAIRLEKPLLGMAFTMMSLALLSGVAILVGFRLHWLADTILTMGMAFLVSFVTLFFPLCFPFPTSFSIFRYITYYPIRLMIWLSHAS